MGFKPINDLCVSAGKYMDNEGKEKNRWQKIGIEMEGDDGQRFILLDRFINIAGFPNPEGRDTVMVSKFDKREGAAGSHQGQAPNRAAPPPARAAQPPAPSARAAPPPRQPNPNLPATGNDFTDDIPF